MSQRTKILFVISALAIGAISSISYATNYMDIFDVPNAPVGTIVASVISPIQFTGGQQLDPKKVNWWPADGSEVRGSIYARIMNSVTVPDLRAMFLRGHNDFRTKKGARTDNYRDTGRRINGFQMDAIEAHNHSYAGPQSAHNGVKPTGGGKVWNSGSEGNKTSLNDDGADETRPKNYAIYYYIKIN